MEAARHPTTHAPQRWQVRDILLLGFPIGITVATWLLFVYSRAPGTSAALHGFPLDDTWIHLVYARNLVEQGGFYYNDGTAETGTTSPLWVVLLAGVYALTGRGPAAGVVLGVKLLSLVFGIAGIVMIYRMSRAFDEHHGIALLAACLAGIDPSLTFARASGMEVSLFLFLTLSALHYAGRARPLAAGTAAGLAVVARPEGVVLFPILLALLLRPVARAQPGHARRVLVACLLAIAPGIAYSGFCLYATGAPLPNTFYAKFSLHGSTVCESLRFGWRHYVHENLGYFTLETGSILALLGLLRLVSRYGLLGLATPLAGAVLFAAPLLSRVFAPGHYFYWERWLTPSFAFLILLMASGVGEIRAGVPSLRRLLLGGRRLLSATCVQSAPEERSRHPVPGIVWAALAWAACALLVLPLPRLLRLRSELYAWNTQNIEEMNVALGRWVNANLAPDAVIAVVDAGALRYFGQRKTLDLFGLNNHRFVRRSFGENMRLLKSLGVRYLILVPALLDGFDEHTLRLLALHPIHSVRAEHYTICDAPQDVMTVYQLGSALPD